MAGLHCIPTLAEAIFVAYMRGVTLASVELIKPSLALVAAKVAYEKAEGWNGPQREMGCEVKRCRNS